MNLKSLGVISILLLSALVTACAADNSTSEINPSLSAGAVGVVAWYPPNDYNLACQNEPIKLTFKTPIDVQTLARRVTVTQIGSGGHSFSCPWSASQVQNGQYQYTCYAQPRFDFGTTIQVTVYNVRDVVDNETPPFSFQFKVVPDSAATCGASAFRPTDVYGLPTGRIFALSGIGATNTEDNQNFEFQNDSWLSSSIYQIAFPIAGSLMIIRFTSSIDRGIPYTNSVFVLKSRDIFGRDFMSRSITSYSSSSSGTGIVGSVLRGTKVHVYGEYPHFECPTDDPDNPEELNEVKADLIDRALVVCPPTDKLDYSTPRLYFVIINPGLYDGAGNSLKVPYLTPFVLNNGIFGSE